MKGVTLQEDSCGFCRSLHAHSMQQHPSLRKLVIILQGHAASQPPRVNVPHQQPPPPPQQQQQQPGVQRLQFGQLGSPPGYSRDEGRQPPLPTDLHLPNGHLSTPPSGECWVGGACSEELVLIGVDFLLGLPEVCCDNVTRLQHIRSQ